MVSIYPIIASVVLFLFVGIVMWGPMVTREVWRWLKGSRTSYYFPAEKTEIYRTNFPCRRYDDRKYIQGSVIEVSRGPFRRRSAIYGSAVNNWKIAGIYQSMNGWNCVELQDRLSVPVETALRLINTYPSLQAMLDRIVDLENGNKSTEARFQMTYAAIVALRFQILSDKQRYRGVVAQELREDLDMVIDKINTLLTDHDSLKVWGERFQERRLKVGQSRVDQT